MPRKRYDRAHPLRVAARQVVVDGDDVDAFAFERVEVCRAAWRPASCLRRSSSRRSCRLCRHHAADQLHVEVPHVQHALAGFADHGERFGEQVVDRLAGGDALR